MARADYVAAKQRFSSIEAATSDTWITFFDSPRGFNILGKLMGDAYGTVKDEEERQAGARRTGASRRAPRSASLDEVFEAIFPDRYSIEPFPVAMEKLLAGRSQRAFAKTAKVHQMTLSRLMRGQYEPDIEMLEKLAKAAKVSPAFFLEWRAQYISSVLKTVFLKKPNLSIGALQLLWEQS